MKRLETRLLDQSLGSYSEVAASIALEAGSLLRYYFERRVTFEMKGEYDLVTEADKASEKLVVERIKQHFPEHGIVAEEGGGHEGLSDYRWFVDPLDGTTNFAHSYPVWNVTLALEKAGELIAGVVFNPNRDELFTAERGGGAFLNGSRIRVSKVARVADALLCTGFPNHNRAVNPNIHYFHELAMTAHGVRRSGSAAIDLSDVACGRLDGFWEIGLSPWDMAAGILLIEEAGGVCTDMQGGRHHLRSPHILTDNGLIHEELAQRFAAIGGGEILHPMPRLQIVRVDFSTRRILDTVLATGEPVEIERKGRVLRIVADKPPASKLARMKKRPGLINGNPEDLVEIDWSVHWNPEGNL